MHKVHLCRYVEVDGGRECRYVEVDGGRDYNQETYGI